MSTDKDPLHDLHLRYSHKCPWCLWIMERELAATAVLLILQARVLESVLLGVCCDLIWGESRPKGLGRWFK